MLYNLSGMVYLVISFISILLCCLLINCQTIVNKITIINISLLSLLNEIIIEIIINDFSIIKYDNMIIKMILSIVIVSFLLLKNLLTKKVLNFGIEFILIIFPLIIGLISIIVKSTDLIFVFVSLEIQGLILYSYISYNNNTIYGKEGAIKYFITGAIASILFLIGIIFVYKKTGNIAINIMDDVSLFYIQISLLIKIGAAPFHYWLADAYEGASLYILLLIVTIPKMVLLYIIYIYNVIKVHNNIIILTLICSLIVGAIGGLKQTKINRFIAYTSIFNNSFFLLLIMLKQYYSMYALILSIMVYILGTIGIILPILIVIFRDTKIKIKSVRDFLNLKKSNYYLSMLMASSFISAAGLPPMSGFFNKLYTFIPLLELKDICIIFLVVIVSIIPSYYYLRMIVMTYFFNESNIFLLDNISYSVGIILCIYLYITFTFIFDLSLIGIIV